MAIKSIVLGPGECVTLPADAVVTSIIVNGAITVESTCGDLPEPSSYKCGVFRFFLDDTSEDDDTAMEEEHVTYSQIVVGENTYIINETAAPATEADINVHVTDLALFEVMSIVKNTDPDDRQLVAVYFQTPEELFDTIVLQLSDRGTLYNLPAYEFDCESYPEPE